jgi:hypothetical protein
VAPTAQEVLTALLAPASLGLHRLPSTQSLQVAVPASCFDDATRRRASSLRGESSGDCSNADDDPPLIIQDMDLLPSLALELSHTENPSPNRVEVVCRMSLSRQTRSVSTDQAEFIIRHSVSSFIRLAVAERLARPKVPPGPII